MMPAKSFPGARRLALVLLLPSLAVTVCGAVREYSTRRYLQGFADAIVIHTDTPQQKVEAILHWMNGRIPLMPRGKDETAWEPTAILNNRRLLSTCGTATNVFISLANHAGIQARRLLLMSKRHETNHVSAEVFLDGRWVVVDLVYRSLLRDASGNLLTKEDLGKPEIFQQVKARIPNYSPLYTYESTAYFRMERIPYIGRTLRAALDSLFPAWETSINWALVVERPSGRLLLLGTSISVFGVFFFLIVWVRETNRWRQLQQKRDQLLEKRLEDGVAIQN